MQSCVHRPYLHVHELVRVAAARLAGSQLILVAVAWPGAISRLADLKTLRITSCSWHMTIMCRVEMIDLTVLLRHCLSMSYHCLSWSRVQSISGKLRKQETTGDVCTLKKMRTTQTYVISHLLSCLHVAPWLVHLFRAFQDPQFSRNQGNTFATAMGPFAECACYTPRNRNYTSYQLH